MRGSKGKIGHVRPGGPIGTASFRLPGILLGLGLGGFVDGILFHQILQWHHMLSSVLPPTTVSHFAVNTLWDGLFHSLTWVFVVVGLVLFWRAVKREGHSPSARTLSGWTLVGWGIFNLVEGTFNHHILQIHHVRSGPHEIIYDLGFLVIGALLVWGGRTLTVSGERPPRRPTTT